MNTSSVTLKSIQMLPSEMVEVLFKSKQIDKELYDSYKSYILKQELGAKLSALQTEFTDGLGKWKPLQDRCIAVQSKIKSEFGDESDQVITATIRIDVKGFEIVKRTSRQGQKGAKGGKYNITCNGVEFTSWSKLCAAHNIEVGGNSAFRVALKNFEGNFPCNDDGKELTSGDKSHAYVLTI